MKFSQLKMGDRFIYQGMELEKCGPLQALEKATGIERVIMRSAAVTPVNAQMEKQPNNNPCLDELKQALADYHRLTLDLLGARQEPQLDKKLGEAYEEMIRLIERSKQSGKQS